MTVYVYHPEHIDRLRRDIPGLQPEEVQATRTCPSDGILVVEAKQLGQFRDFLERRFKSGQEVPGHAVILGGDPNANSLEGSLPITTSWVLNPVELGVAIRRRQIPIARQVV